MKTKAIISLSGGLDSTTLLYHITKDLKREVFAIGFDYGQNHKSELEYAKYHCDKLSVKFQVIDLNSYFHQINNTSTLLQGSESVSKGEYSKNPPDTYVSNRNLLFTLIMASIAEREGANELYLGIQRVDSFNGYWDTSESFVNKTQELLNLNPAIDLKIVTPFVNMTKSDEILIGNRLGLDYSKTMSCYRGSNCGDCATCIERIGAFNKLNMKDPVQYV